MAQDTAAIKAAYPLPAYNYRVTLLTANRSLVLGFSEVSGLSLDYEPVTYRHGLSFAMGFKLIPGMTQPLTLTLKRGVARSRNELYDWLDNVYNDPFSSDKSRDLLIDLCDEAGDVVVRWTVQGALPTKLEAPSFDAQSNEVAIETLELIAQGLQIDYNP